MSTERRARKLEGRSNAGAGFPVVNTGIWHAVEMGKHGSDYRGMGTYLLMVRFRPVPTKSNTV